MVVDPDGHLYLDAGKDFLVAQREKAGAEQVVTATDHDNEQDSQYGFDNEHRVLRLRPIREDTPPEQQKPNLKDLDKGKPANAFSPTDNSLHILVCSNVMAPALLVFARQLNGNWKDFRKNVNRDGDDNKKMVLT